MAAQCAVECDQPQRHVGHAQPGCGDTAASLLTQQATAMRIVHVQQRGLQACQQRQRTQRCKLTIAAEHAFADHHRHMIGRTAELAHRALGILVRIAAQARAGQARGIQQAAVVAGVLHAEVVLLAQQHLLHGEVGRMAAFEQHRAGHFQPIGDLALECFMQGVAAGAGKRAVCTEAIARGGILQRVDDTELLAKTEVVGTVEGGQPAALDLHPDAIAAADDRHRPPMQGRRRLGTLGVDTRGQFGTGHDHGGGQGGAASVTRRARGCAGAAGVPRRYWPGSR